MELGDNVICVRFLSTSLSAGQVDYTTRLPSILAFNGVSFERGLGVGGGLKQKCFSFRTSYLDFLYMLRRVGDLLAVRARDKMAHSMGLLFITESIAKV